MTYVVINGQSYLVDTEEQTAEAQAMLAVWGIESATVYAGDPECPDSYATGQKLFAATRQPEIRDAIVDATVTKDGVEVTDYSECYLALAQDLDGTLPAGYVVDWGPRSQQNKRVISQAPSEIWERATRGELTL